MSGPVAWSHCGTLAASLKHMLHGAAVGVSEEECLLFVWHYTSLIRSAVLKPLCINGTHTSPLHLTLKQFSDVWYKKCDPKLVAGLGDGVGIEAPSKKCGSMLDSLLGALDEVLKKKKSTELDHVADILEAFASTRMTEWTNGFMLTQTTNLANERQRQDRAAFVSSILSVVFSEWSTLYRDRKTLGAEIADFREMVLSKTTIFAHIFSSVNHVVKNSARGASGYAQTLTALASAEQTSKHRQVGKSLELWLASRSGGGAGAGGAGGAADPDAPRRVCKAGHGVDITCCEGERDIASSAKYVLLRCTEGCVLSFHQSCWRSHEPERPEDGSLPLCPNRHGCTGRVNRVVLKQSGKIIAELDGDALDGEDTLPDDESEDEEDPEEAALRIGSHVPITAIQGRAITRGQKTSLFKYEGALGPDGLLLYRDEVAKFEQKQQRLEKKERAEERAAEKKRKEEELAAKTPPEKDTNKSTHSPPTKSKSTKPFLIEVVVPLVRQPGEQPVSFPATKSNLSSSSSSSSTATTHKNAFQSLNLDADSERERRYIAAGHLVRNAWQDGPEEAYDPNEHEPAPVQSLFPITVKKAKTKKNGGGGGGVAYYASGNLQDEDAQMRAAMAASLAEARAAKMAPPVTAAQALFGKSSSAPSVADRDSFPGLPTSTATPTPKKVVPAGKFAAAMPIVVSVPLVPELSRPSSSASAAGARLEGEEEPGSGDEGVSQSQSSVASAESSRSVSPVRSAASSVPSFTPTPTPPPSQQAAQPFQRAVTMPIGSVKAVALPMASSAGAIGLSLASALAMPSAKIVAKPMASSIASAYLPPSAVNVRAPPPIQAPAPVHAAPLAMAPLPMAPISSTPPLPIAPPMASGMAPLVSMAAIPQAVAAATAAAAATPFAKLDVVDSVLDSPTPTCALLLRDLPTCLSIQLIGQQFCVYGRVQVRIVFTLAHAMTAIVTYPTAQQAERALAEMKDRVYELSTRREQGSDMEQWHVDPIYARHPVQLVRPTPGSTTIRCISK